MKQFETRYWLSWACIGIALVVYLALPWWAQEAPSQIDPKRFLLYRIFTGLYVGSVVWLVFTGHLNTRAIAKAPRWALATACLLFVVFIVINLKHSLGGDLVEAYFGQLERWSARFGRGAKQLIVVGNGLAVVVIFTYAYVCYQLLNAMARTQDPIQLRRMGQDASEFVFGASAVLVFGVLTIFAFQSLPVTEWVAKEGAPPDPALLRAQSITLVAGAGFTFILVLFAYPMLTTYQRRIEQLADGALADGGKGEFFDRDKWLSMYGFRESNTLQLVAQALAVLAPLISAVLPVALR